MTTTTTTEIDWWACAQVAQGLGINTRRLVALQDTDAAIDWALEMSRGHTGVAAISYYELAVMLGHRDRKVAAGASLDWSELLMAVEKLQATVAMKAAEEKKAAEQAAAAERKAAEEAAAAARAAEEAALAALEEFAADVESDAVEVIDDAA